MGYYKDKELSSGTTLDKWIDELVKAGIVPPETRRIIIDIPLEDAVKVYYECFADEKMFTVDCVAMLKGAKAISVTEAAKT